MTYLPFFNDCVKFRLVFWGENLFVIFNSGFGIQGGFQYLMDSVRFCETRINSFIVQKAQKPKA